MLAIKEQKTSWLRLVGALHVMVVVAFGLFVFSSAISPLAVALTVQSAAAQSSDGAADPIAEDEEPTLSGALGAAAVGAGLIGWRVYRKRRRLAARAWPETEGEIIFHKVDEVDTSTSDDHSADYRYYPRIRYRYTAAGEVRESGQIGMDVPSFGEASGAEQYLAEKFPMGTRVPVLFNPKKPTDAMLVRPNEKPGIVWQAGHWTVISIGAIVFLGGLVVLLDLLL